MDDEFKLDQNQNWGIAINSWPEGILRSVPKKPRGKKKSTSRRKEIGKAPSFEGIRKQGTTEEEKSRRATSSEGEKNESNKKWGGSTTRKEYIKAEEAAEEESSRRT